MESSPRTTTAPHDGAFSHTRDGLQDDVRATLDRLLRRLGPDAAFGAPVERDGVTAIPVSEVRVGFGFGSGFGRDAEPEAPVGGGGGAGGGGRVVPRGVVEVRAGGVRFVPTVDATRLALGALAVVGLLVAGRTLARARES